jgi:hypothetical protein
LAQASSISSVELVFLVFFPDPAVVVAAEEERYKDLELRGLTVKLFCGVHPRRS